MFNIWPSTIYQQPMTGSLQQPVLPASLGKSPSFDCKDYPGNGSVSINLWKEYPGYDSKNIVGRKLWSVVVQYLICFFFFLFKYHYHQYVFDICIF